MSEHSDRKGSSLLYTPVARSACIVVITLAVIMQTSYAARSIKMLDKRGPQAYS